MTILILKGGEIMKKLIIISLIGITMLTINAPVITIGFAIGVFSIIDMSDSCSNLLKY